MLDHLCDILFILAALGYFAWQGLAPWWFPAAIAWAFGLYVFDSWWRTTGQQRRLIGSRLGHLGGMLNYLAVGLLTVNIAVGYPLLSATLLWTICLGLTCLALLSGAERLWGLVSGWRAHVKQAGLCVLLLVQTGANTLPV
jgi:phosphatidylglycerophosphate synthase